MQRFLLITIIFFNCQEDDCKVQAYKDYQDAYYVTDSKSVTTRDEVNYNILDLSNGRIEGNNLASTSFDNSKDPKELTVNFDDGTSYIVYSDRNWSNTSTHTFNTLQITKIESDACVRRRWDNLQIEFEVWPGDWLWTASNRDISRSGCQSSYYGSFLEAKDTNVMDFNVMQNTNGWWEMNNRVTVFAVGPYFTDMETATLTKLTFEENTGSLSNALDFDWDDEDTLKEISCDDLGKTSTDSNGDFVWKEYRGR